MNIAFRQHLRTHPCPPLHIHDVYVSTVNIYFPDTISSLGLFIPTPTRQDNELKIPHRRWVEVKAQNVFVTENGVYM